MGFLKGHRRMKAKPNFIPGPIQEKSKTLLVAQHREYVRMLLSYRTPDKHHETIMTEIMQEVDAGKMEGPFDVPIHWHEDPHEDDGLPEVYSNHPPLQKATEINRTIYVVALVSPVSASQLDATKSARRRGRCVAFL